MKKVHLLYRKLNYHACGVGNKNSVVMSVDPKEVTCERCLRTIAGQKVSAGRTSTNNAKISITIRLPKHLVEWVDVQRGSSDRTQLIVEALEAFRDRESKILKTQKGTAKC